MHETTIKMTVRVSVTVYLYHVIFLLSQAVVMDWLQQDGDVTGVC